MSLPQKYSMKNIIKWFLNEDGIVKKRPSKKTKQLLILEYISERIPENQKFTEKEFNAILNDLHTFGNAALLRRELYIKNHIDRTNNGSLYWKQEIEEHK